MDRRWLVRKPTVSGVVENVQVFSIGPSYVLDVKGGRYVVEIMALASALTWLFCHIVTLKLSVKP